MQFWKWEWSHLFGINLTQCRISKGEIWAKFGEGGDRRHFENSFHVFWSTERKKENKEEFKIFLYVFWNEYPILVPHEDFNIFST